MPDYGVEAILSTGAGFASPFAAKPANSLSASIRFANRATLIYLRLNAVPYTE